ncbi:MAG: hypothetical protein U0840_19945 [Gemmataceae bacterium]
MQRAERALRLLLRFEATVVALAAPAALLPSSWMDAVHQVMGLGPLPRGPIIEYLTRTLSMMYAAWAPLLWLMSRDVRRYLPVIRLISWLTVAGAVLFPLVDHLAGMPLPWLLIEGGVLLGYGATGLVLTRAIQSGITAPVAHCQEGSGRIDSAQTCTQETTP